jgi:hypothetical protein
MPAFRKSTAQIDARRRAREAAALFRERENTLEELAVDYFAQAAVIEKINEDLEQQIERLRERSAQETQSARAASESVMAKMLDLGVARSEVAARLGVATRDVRRPIAEPDETAPAAEPAVNADVSAPAGESEAGGEGEAGGTGWPHTSEQTS